MLCLHRNETGAESSVGATGPTHKRTVQQKCDPTPGPEGGLVSTHLASFICISLSFCCIWLFRSITNWANFGGKEHVHH